MYLHTCIYIREIPRLATAADKHLLLGIIRKSLTFNLSLRYLLRRCSVFQLSSSFFFFILFSCLLMLKFSWLHFGYYDLICDLKSQLLVKYFILFQLTITIFGYGFISISFDNTIFFWKYFSNNNFFLLSNFLLQSIFSIYLLRKIFDSFKIHQNL